MIQNQESGTQTPKSPEVVSEREKFINSLRVVSGLVGKLQDKMDRGIPIEREEVTDLKESGEALVTVLFRMRNELTIDVFSVTFKIKSALDARVALAQERLSNQQTATGAKSAPQAKPLIGTRADADKEPSRAPVAISSLHPEDFHSDDAGNILFTHAAQLFAVNHSVFSTALNRPYSASPGSQRVAVTTVDNRNLLLVLTEDDHKQIAKKFGDTTQRLEDLSRSHKIDVAPQIPGGSGAKAPVLDSASQQQGMSRSGISQPLTPTRAAVHTGELGLNRVIQASASIVTVDGVVRQANVRISPEIEAKLQRERSTAIKAFDKNTNAKDFTFTNDLALLYGEKFSFNSLVQLISGRGELNRYVVEDKLGDIYHLPIRNEQGNLFIIRMSRSAYLELKSTLLPRVGKDNPAERMMIDRQDLNVAEKTKSFTQTTGRDEIARIGTYSGEQKSYDSQGRQFLIEVSGATTHGERPGTNEDMIASYEVNLADGTRVVVQRVYDGMGGAEAGDAFSSFVAQAELEFLTTLSEHDLKEIKAEALGRNVSWKAILMERALQYIAKTSYDWTVEQGKAQGLKDKLDSGATITGGYVIGNEFVAGNVGDSRTSIVRNNQMVFETVDHSFVEFMVSTGQMTREAAENHQDSSRIYRSLGDKPVLSIEHKKVGRKREPFVVAVEELQDGDIVTITCDGVSDALTNKGLSPATVLQSENFSLDIAEKMIGKATGSKDNDTALVFRFKKS